MNHDFRNLSFGRVVEVEGGAIRAQNTADMAVEVALGIPYAAAPIGQMRWRPPAPVRPWSGVRPADRFGPASMQGSPPLNSILAWSMATPEPFAMSEDCLYLNVWAPRDVTNAPVVVWVHGGGHRFGSGAQLRSNGEELARLGNVVVSHNYRLGVLGFLAHPELSAEAGTDGSGNYALMDTLAALRWVQNNVHAFGGDPSNVTLAGHSVGCAQIAALMADHAGKDLFRRVILQSPMGVFVGPAAPKTLAQAESAGLRLAENFGAKTIADLRQIPAVDFCKELGYGPVIDNTILKKSIVASFRAGTQLPLPALIGSNADEGTPYPHPRTLAAFQASALQTYPDRATKFMATYPASTDEEAMMAAQASVRDSTVGIHESLFSRLHSESSPVYRYHFSARPPLPLEAEFREFRSNTAYGAYHGAEIPYVFNALARFSSGWTEEDVRLASEMSRAWSNFARSGVPDLPAGIAWPPFTGDRHEVMHFKRETTFVGDALHDSKISFFEEHYAL